MNIRELFDYKGDFLGLDTYLREYLLFHICASCLYFTCLFLLLVLIYVLVCCFIPTEAMTPISVVYHNNI